MANDAALESVCTYLAEVGLQPPDRSWREQIKRLYRLVVDANRHTNLTRLTTFDDFLIKHVADSLLILSVLPELTIDRLDIADVGCGAGFPGLPLALTFDQCTVTEIDSTAKKTAFVQSAVSALSLGNCRVINGRARELSRQDAWRDRFDVVVVRAVKDMAYVIRECRRLLHPETGRLVAYKTPAGIQQEFGAAEREAVRHGFRLDASPTFTLPDGAGERRFITASPARLHRCP